MHTHTHTTHTEVHLLLPQRKRKVRFSHEMPFIVSPEGMGCTPLNKRPHTHTDTHTHGSHMQAAATMPRWRFVYPLRVAEIKASELSP